MIGLSSVLAGSIAGACGILVGHPFDSLKVRVQVGASLRGHAIDMKTMRQLYRGVMPPLLTTGTIQAINFTLYEHFKHNLHISKTGQALGGNELYSLNTTFWGGTLAGSAISMITLPIGIIKIQQQVHSEAGIWSCVRELYAKSGARAFYRGFACAYVLEGPGRGVYLWSYETVKTFLAKVIHHQNRPNSKWEDINTVQAYKTAPFAVSVIAGACAGIFSWLVVYPFDVIKSRLQSDAHGLKYSSMMQCFQLTWREGGIRSLFRGIGFTLVRAGPVAASVLPVYELVKGYIDKALLVQEYQAIRE